MASSHFPESNALFWFLNARDHYLRDSVSMIPLESISNVFIYASSGQGQFGPVTYRITMWEWSGSVEIRQKNIDTSTKYFLRGRLLPHCTVILKYCTAWCCNIVGNENANSALGYLVQMIMGNVSRPFNGFLSLFFILFIYFFWVNKTE